MHYSRSLSYLYDSREAKYCWADFFDRGVNEAALTEMQHDNFMQDLCDAKSSKGCITLNSKSKINQKWY